MSAHVQTDVTLAAANTTTSKTITLTTGNAVIVTLFWDTSLAGVGTVNQTAGDTVALVASINHGGIYQAQYLCHSVAGGSTTFTFTWSGSTPSSIVVTEVSGLAASSAFDQTASNNSAVSATHTSGTTPTLSQADEFAYATWHGDSSGTTGFTSVSNGFTVPTNGSSLSGASNGCRYVVAYKAVSATTAVESTLTMADNWFATGLIATYKDDAGEPPASTGGAFPRWRSVRR
jgi:hypothetical protein